MKFGEEIFKALTGREQEPTSSAQMFEQIEDHRAQVGLSRRGFARQSGIAESTLRHWEKKGFSSRSDAANLSRLTVAYRSLIADPAAVTRWRANDMVVHLESMPTKHHGRTAYKSMDLKCGSPNQGLRLVPGTGDKVVAHFLRGDDKGAAHAFVKGIGDGWYRQVLFADWIGNHDEDLADLDLGEASEYEGNGDYPVEASVS